MLFKLSIFVFSLMSTALVVHSFDVQTHLESFLEDGEVLEGFYDQNYQSYAPIAGGVDKFILGFISGVSEDPVYPNVCILFYQEIYKAVLLYEEALNVYQMADSTSFSTLDVFVKMFRRIEFIDRGCGMTEYLRAVQTKLNNMYYLQNNFWLNVKENQDFLYQEFLIGFFGYAYNRKEDMGEFVGALLSKGFDESLDTHNPNPEDYIFVRRVV